MRKIDSITLHVGHVVSVEVTPLIDKVIQIAKKGRQAGMTKVDAVSASNIGSEHTFIVRAKCIIQFSKNRFVAYFSFYKSSRFLAIK